MVIINALFYAYYLITISITRYADTPLTTTSCFVALGVCTNLLFLDKTPFAKHLPHENVPWIILGFYLATAGLMYIYFANRHRKIIARFEKTGTLSHLLIMAWGIVFPCIGLICWKVCS